MSGSRWLWRAARINTGCPRMGVCLPSLRHSTAALGNEPPRVVQDNGQGLFHESTPALLVPSRKRLRNGLPRNAANRSSRSRMAKQVGGRRQSTLSAAVVNIYLHGFKRHKPAAAPFGRSWPAAADFGQLPLFRNLRVGQSIHGAGHLTRARRARPGACLRRNRHPPHDWPRRGEPDPAQRRAGQPLPPENPGRRGTSRADRPGKHQRHQGQRRDGAALGPAAGRRRCRWAARVLLFGSRDEIARRLAELRRPTWPSGIRSRPRKWTSRATRSRWTSS